MPPTGAPLSPDMWIAAAVLLGAYLLIFTEILHRTSAAVVGAVAMVGVGVGSGFYSQEQALQALDANTLLLLLAMMLLVAIVRPTGVFEYLAIRLAKLAGGRPRHLLIYLGVAVSALSMFLDNVTTVLIFAPPNLMIGSAAGLDFSTFLSHMLPMVLPVWLSLSLALLLVRPKPEQLFVRVE